jgi:OPT oligopeptide transporter protein
MCDSLRSGASRSGGSLSCHSEQSEESLNISRQGKRGQKCIASLANNNLQDLKTGQLVDATPWKQQVALVIGVIAGAQHDR